MHIDLKFNLILEWLDHKVEWVNLKADNHLNTLSNIELDKLWLPKVLFQNSDNIEPIKHKDSSTVVIVRRQGEGKIREGDDGGVLSYMGDENPLVYQRKYQQRFYCTFDFRWYPFDSQECGIDLTNFDTLKVQILNTFGKITSELRISRRWKLVGWNTLARGSCCSTR